MGKFKQIIMRAAGAVTAAVLAAGFFSLLPLTADAAGGNCGGSATWDYSGDTLTISGTGAVTLAGWTSCKNTVKKVVIKDGITSVMQNAFQAYPALESIEIADTVTSLGANFCYGCTALKQVKFSKNLKTIPNNGFYGCKSLSSLELPSSLQTIGTQAFYGNLSLKELALPDGVTSVQRAAFMGTNLKTLSLGKSLEYIYDQAFAPGCFPSVVIPDTIKSIGSKAIGLCYDSVQASGDSFTGRSGGNPVKTVLYGKPGTAAETYANSNGLVFKSSSGSDPVQTHTHSWSAWSPAAKCDEAVVQTRKCSSCGETETQTVQATGHSFGNWSVSTRAGCETAGEEVRECANCHKTETRTVSATGHSWGTPQYAWSADHSQCTASRTCANCRKSETETAQSTYSEKKPGVGVPGEGVYQVEFNNSAFTAQSVKVEIPAIDSNWTAPEYKWSADGKSCTATRKELNSGKTESETVQAELLEYVSPTCTKKGKAVYTADFENPAFSEQTRTEDIPAKGHNWSAWTVDVPAGCESDGRESRTCSGCNETELRLTDPIGHSYGNWTVKTPAGCENDGAEERKCVNCGNTETRTISATGHSFGDWTVKTAPTCEKQGVEQRKCKNCGKTEEQFIRSLGHEWSAWKTTREATIDKCGLEESKCARCGQTRTQETPVLTSYVISVSANEGGTVSPNGEIRAAEGSSTTITFRANNGYRIAAVLLDGESVSQNGSLTISNLSSNHTVSVVFQQNAPQIVRSCIAVSASPKRNVWLKDEATYKMSDFTLVAVISENGQTKEADITNDCYTNVTPASGNAVTFKYRGSDKDIQSYFSTHGIGCSVPVHLRGDADLNGRVEVEDAMLALKHYVNGVAGKKTEILSDVQKTVTDVDEKDGATLQDATYILRYYTKSFAGLKPTWADVIK